MGAPVGCDRACRSHTDHRSHELHERRKVHSMPTNPDVLFLLSTGLRSRGGETDLPRNVCDVSNLTHRKEFVCLFFFPVRVRLRNETTNCRAYVHKTIPDKAVEKGAQRRTFLSRAEQTKTRNEGDELSMPPPPSPPPGSFSSTFSISKMRACALLLRVKNSEGKVKTV